MRYCFDLDSTICETPNGDYPQAKPIPKMVEWVNALYDMGHYIIIWTARGTMTNKSWRNLTEKQLKEWGVNYHELHFGKPYADVYVDDRAVRPEALCPS